MIDGFHFHAEVVLFVSQRRLIAWAFGWSVPLGQHLLPLVLVESQVLVLQKLRKVELLGAVYLNACLLELAEAYELVVGLGMLLANLPTESIRQLPWDASTALLLPVQG